MYQKEYYHHNYPLYNECCNPCPPKEHVNICPTQQLPAQISPTKNIVNKNICKQIVPHIHPTHTTTVNKHIYQHEHHFPHTHSVVNTCCSEDIICHQPICPPNPCIQPRMRPF